MQCIPAKRVPSLNNGHKPLFPLLWDQYTAEGVKLLFGLYFERKISKDIIIVPGLCLLTRHILQPLCSAPCKLSEPYLDFMDGLSRKKVIPVSKVGPWTLRKIKVNIKLSRCFPLRIYKTNT